MGGNTAKPRFNLKISATHQYSFTHVYFTLDSIKGKTAIKIFEPQINYYAGCLNGYRVNCCWMDENKASYSSDYVCEIDDEKEGPFNFIGYDVNQYIA